MIGLGEEYMINRVAPKIYDGCRHIHAPIDAVMELMHRNNLKVENMMIENAVLGKPTEIPRGGEQKDDLVYSKDIASAVVLACFAENL